MQKTPEEKFLILLLSFFLLAVGLTAGYQASAQIDPTPAVGTCSVRLSSTWVTPTGVVGAVSASECTSKALAHIQSGGYPSAFLAGGYQHDTDLRFWYWFINRGSESSPLERARWQTSAPIACPGGTTFDPDTGFCEDDDPPQVCEVDAPTGYFFEVPASPLNYLPPALVCHDNCRYINHSTIYDTDDGGVYNLYRAMGADCTGEDHPIVLTEGTDPNPGDEDKCYITAGMMQCWNTAENGGNDPVACYTEDGATVIQCPQRNYNPPDDPTEPEPDVPPNTAKREQCGHVAGVYQCTDNSRTQCGYVNGEPVCFATGGVYPMAPDSPDNPRNGGNADGNETNDVYPNASAVNTNGLSTADLQREIQKYSNQSLIERQNFDGLERAIREQTAVLEGGIPVEIDLGEYDLPDGQGIIDDAVQEVVDTIGTVGTAPGLSIDGGLITSMVPGGLIPDGGSCGVVPFDLEVLTLSVDICQVESARTVLGWVFYVMTAWSLFGLVVRPNRVQEA